METYITYDNTIPLEKKMLVTSTLKLDQSILEQMVRDVRKNKPKDLPLASGEKK